MKLRLLGAVGIVAVVVGIAGTLTAQTPATSLAFEVASIKPHNGGDAGGSIGREPGGRWVMSNIAIMGLIRSAYPTKVDPIGAESWVTSERFDVDARPAFEPTREQEQGMLRALLAERLKFKVHYETQQRPIYNLVVARADGRLGPRIHSIDIDCATYQPDRSVEPSSQASKTDPPPCTFRIDAVRSETMVSGGRTMQQLADSVSNVAGRPIFDKTGLSGYYAFTLEDEGFDPNGLSIFTALQEQLGLKLESTTGPVDVLVIDHVEHPTPD